MRGDDVREGPFHRDANVPIESIECHLATRQRDLELFERHSVELARELAQCAVSFLAHARKDPCCSLANRVIDGRRPIEERGADGGRHINERATVAQLAA
jgi:hypothetical protein